MTHSSHRLTNMEVSCLREMRSADEPCTSIDSLGSIDFSDLVYLSPLSLSHTHTRKTIVSDPISLPSSTLAHPITLDATGSMRTDLLAHQFDSSSSTSELSLWRNLFRQTDSNGNQTSGFQLEKSPLNSSSTRSKTSGCQLANPHSSAFIDLNGDCLADLFLVCSSSSSSQQKTYQIWTAIPNNDNKEVGSGYKLAREGNLPFNSGALSFADMDRDGTIDVVFPTCDKGEDMDGVGKGECFINIAYNKQIGLCSSKGGLTSGGGGAGGNALSSARINSEREEGRMEESRDENYPKLCRRTEELCSPDDNFVFDFSKEVSRRSFLLSSLIRSLLFCLVMVLWLILIWFSSLSSSTSFQALTRIPISNLLGSTTARILLTDIYTTPSTPLPFSLGDHNKDGYPDLALLVADSSSTKFSSPETRVHLLTSVPCGHPPSSNPFATKPPTKPGCKDGATLQDGTRTLVEEKEGSGVLSGIKDVRRVSWLDVDEDVSILERCE